MSRAPKGWDKVNTSTAPQTPSRRDLLGTAGAALLLCAAEAGPAKAAELDGPLLRACTAAMAIEAESDRLWDACKDCISSRHSPEWAAWEAHVEDARDRWRILADQIATTPARTPEGLAAKVRVTMTTLPNNTNPDPWEPLVASLCRDVLGRAGA